MIRRMLSLIAMVAVQLPAAGESYAVDRRELAKELSEFVYGHHAVTDPNRPTYGMTYEFFRDGKQIQDFGLDSLHDGAWFTLAMLSAERAWPEDEYLKRVLKYQGPFYVNLLCSSDLLFPLIKKTDEDKAPLERPMRGRIPLAWDDGGGFDLNTGKQHQAKYNTHQGPNHLGQDVADALLGLWLATRSPEVAEAAMLQHQERLANFGTVPPIAFAAGFTSGDDKLASSIKLPKFKPTEMPGYSGLYQQNGEPLQAYDDPLSWWYDQAMALATRDGEMDGEFVAFAAARAHGDALTMEHYYDDRPWPPGLHFFDIQGQPKFIAKEGRLDAYASTDKRLMGGRGIQMAWVAAAILPELRRRPEIWEAYCQRNYGSEPLVRIVDELPKLDGKRDDVYGRAAWTLGKSEIFLVSDPKNLYVLFESTDAASSSTQTARFEIAHAGQINGTKRIASVSARADGKIAVLVRDENAKLESQERLVHEDAFLPGEKWSAEVRIPYSVMPGQRHWINGIDHGRYAMIWEDAEMSSVYMLSSPERMIRRLENYVDGTIETWANVWKELGVMPSGYRGTNAASKHWEISDTGNYAHLIRLLALREIDRQGKSEWEIIRDRRPKAPIPLEPLPESVLQAQTAD